MPRRKGDAKASYKLAQIMDPGFELPTDRSELLKVYRTAAKAADQRLVRLEKLTQEENFKIANKWAYARAMYDIEQYSGEGATRFNVKPPKTLTGLTAKIEDIKTFLQSVSSTKIGIKKIYIDRTNKINKDYGTNFKWTEIETFFEDERWRTIGGGKREKKGKYESGTALKAIGTFKKKYNKKQFEKLVKEANTADIKVPDSQVEYIMREILNSKEDSEMIKELLYQ